MPTPLLLLCSMVATAPAPTPDPAPAPEGMVLVPAGKFSMGSSDGAYDEAPRHEVQLSAFFIDRHEVTNGAFAAFLRATDGFDRVEGPWFRYSVEGCRDLIRHYEQRYGHPLAELASSPESAGAADLDVERWRAAVSALATMTDGADPARVAAGQTDLPVRGVTWRDAARYAAWAGKRLPTEAEWEKAARGVDGRIYPWGAEWDAGRCHAGEESTAGPVRVGSFLEGASPYGCLDMAGNVWEWVADWYGETYYVTSGGAQDPQGPAGLADGQLPAPDEEINLLATTRQGRETDTRKVIRGGGWSGSPRRAQFEVRTTRRLWSNPSYWHPDVGFRCAKDAP